MALPNAYAQYNNSRILTASPAELTLLLYEGAIKFGNIAILKMEQKDIQGAHNERHYCEESLQIESHSDIITEKTRFYLLLFFFFLEVLIIISIFAQ